MRVNFPLWLLGQDTPVFRPGESNLARKLSLIDRSAPLLLLYQSLVKLGHDVGQFEPGTCDLNFFWTSKLQPASERDRSVILEVAWIPRWQYQVSPTGSNFCGHYAREYQFSPLDDEALEFIKSYASNLRAIYARSVDPRKVERLRALLPADVVLFPLQLANDFNLRFSDTEFARLYTTTDENNVALAKACMAATDVVSGEIPVLFKQHPVDATPDFKARFGADRLIFDNTDDYSTHEIFASGRCRAVISVNSNTLHEAAVWNVPAISLGKLIWDRQTRTPPFSSDVSDLPRVIRTRPLDDPKVLAYLHYLVRQQWTLADFQNLLMVEELVRTKGRCEPFGLRERLGLPSDGGPQSGPSCVPALTSQEARRRTSS